MQEPAPTPAEPEQLQLAPNETIVKNPVSACPTCGTNVITPKDMEGVVHEGVPSVCLYWECPSCSNEWVSFEPITPDTAERIAYIDSIVNDYVTNRRAEALTLTPQGIMAHLLMRQMDAVTATRHGHHSSPKYTRPSHEEPKKKRKMAKASRRINRKK